MPLWRFSDDVHTAMRGHEPFEHSLDADRNPVVVSKYHFLAEGRPQSDGSWVVACSRNVSAMLKADGFEHELFVEPPHNPEAPGEAKR